MTFSLLALALVAISVGLILLQLPRSSKPKPPARDEVARLESGRPR